MSVYDKHKLNLTPVKEQPWWPDYQKDLIDNIPEIPPYSPGKTEEDWEYMSGMQQGYLLALSHLGVKP